MKSFVISVPSLYHRLEETFWKSFSSSELINPELFVGVEGKNHKLPEWWVSKTKGRAIIEHTNEKGMWGLIQSYLNLFDKLIDEKIDEPFLILEDDSVVIDENNFDHDLKNFIEHLPDDWQVGYISGYIKKHITETKKINDYVSESLGIMQTNAIVYKDYKILELLRNIIQHHDVSDPIDFYFLQTLRWNEIPIYYSNKKLILQHPYISSAVNLNSVGNAGSLYEWFVD